MLSRSEISEVMAAVDTSELTAVVDRNKARYDAVESFLKKQPTQANWIGGKSEAEAILSDLHYYKEWEHG